MVMKKRDAVDRYEDAVDEIEDAYQDAAEENTVSGAAEILEKAADDQITSSQMADNYEERY